jgi:hypothetical protein
VRSIVAGAAREGSYIASLELTAEMVEVASVFNAMDKDNMPYPGQMVSGNLRNGAFGTISFHGMSDVRTVNHIEGQSGLLYPIPDDDGNPWLIERPTSDGMLLVSFFSTCTTEQALRVALRVGGRLFNAPWSNRSAGYDSQLFRCIVPVYAGTTLIEPLYAHNTSHQAPPIPDWATSWEDCLVIARELAR